MRVLVVGAGAIGGYFGGRLLEAGCDVSFLVRSRRGAELARTGLVIRSRLGDIDFSAPPTVTADTLRQSFDLVLLGCKAYDLVDAMTSFAPPVGPKLAKSFAGVDRVCRPAAARLMEIPTCRGAARSDWRRKPARPRRSGSASSYAP